MGGGSIHGFRDIRSEAIAKAPSSGLGALFKPPFDMIYNGTFEQAKMMGQHQFKWVLIDLFVS